VWWYRSVIPALRRLKQEVCEFEVKEILSQGKKTKNPGAGGSLL
jgi:hypothetical protein